MRLISFLFLASLGLASAAAAQANVTTPVDLSAYVMDQCDEFSQAGIRECLTGKVKESVRELIVTEEKAGAALKRWDEEAEFVARAEEKLRSSRKAFLAYRDSQCIFAASLGGGAIPKALQMRQLACLYAINTERSQHLKRLIADIPSK